MNGKRLLGFLCLSFAAFGTSACATFEGSPRRLLGEQDSMSLVNLYPMDLAIGNFFQPDTAEGNDYRGQLTRQQYRDMVVIIYMNAMDARYHEFRTMLSSERRQTDFALDLAVLGFTGWASVARESIVNNLSAVAAGFAGARSSVDRNLYFDQALPGLIATMDAQRLRARAQMLTQLQRPAGDYPLPTAFADLMGYEVSSTLNSAVTQMTAAAAQDRQAAQEELAQVVQACNVVDADAVLLNNRLAKFSRDLQNPDNATSADSLAARTHSLRQAALIAGVAPNLVIGEPAAVGSAFRQRLLEGNGGRCRASELQTLIERIQNETGRIVQP